MTTFEPQRCLSCRNRNGATSCSCLGWFSWVDNTSCLSTDQSLMAKSTCYKRRDELTAADAAAAVHARTTTTSTAHVAGTPDHQCLAPAQVSAPTKRVDGSLDLLVLGHIECMRCGLLRSMIPASVSLSVSVTRAGWAKRKNGWTDRRSVWGGDAWRPQNIVLDGVLIPHGDGDGVRYGL